MSTLTPPSYWYPLAIPTFGDAEIHSAMQVLRSGNTTMGEQVEAFEREFAHYVGARHAVMVNSGSSADLVMAFATVKGEVLIPAVTWPTHVWAWKMAGAPVKLIDVKELNVIPATIEAARTENTTSISLVHLMGVPAKIGASCEGLDITEDCCEALGAPVGHLGLAATWSFFFSHQLSTMEGGMVTTNDPALASYMRTLRSHGWNRHVSAERYTFVDWGFNLRPTEVQAAIGRVQLKRLDNLNDMRKRNYSLFVDVLGDNPNVHIPRSNTASWFGLPIFVEDPTALAKHLEDHGVETRPILAGNLTRQRAGVARGLTGVFPGADLLHDHGLYIGLHPSLKPSVITVAEMIDDFL